MAGGLLQRAFTPLTAFFGLPHPVEQLPQRAVQVALAIRHLVEGGVTEGGEPCPTVAH